jgi:hypothetical protein
MSNVFKGFVEDEKYFILPVCNLDITDNELEDIFGIDIAPTGFRPRGTTQANTENSLYKNVKTISFASIVRKLEIDYISFSGNSLSHQTLDYDYSKELMINLIYNHPTNSNFNIYPNLTTSYFKYTVQTRVVNGKRYPIDIKTIDQLVDVFVTTTVQSSSVDRINKAVPFNITFWKKFYKSDIKNKDSFLIDGKLPGGVNPAQLPAP